MLLPPRERERERERASMQRAHVTRPRQAVKVVEYRPTADSIEEVVSANADSPRFSLHAMPLLGLGPASPSERQQNGKWWSGSAQRRPVTLPGPTSRSLHGEVRGVAPVASSISHHGHALATESVTSNSNSMYAPRARLCE